VVDDCERAHKGLTSKKDKLAEQLFGVEKKKQADTVRASLKTTTPKKGARSARISLNG